MGLPMQKERIYQDGLKVKMEPKKTDKEDVEIKPMASTRTISWPTVGEKVSDQDFKNIRKYANDKGVQLAGVKGSDLDIELVTDVIDKTAEILNKYNIQELIQHPFTLDFSYSLRPMDFAESYPGTKHIIYFNKDAYRNRDAISREYEALEKENFFAKGTTYKSIPYHEMGHIVADVYDINPFEIAKKITELTDDADVLEYVTENLSIYAGKLSGDEIIAECFSSAYSGQKNSFALRFLEECDKIILEGR